LENDAVSKVRGRLRRRGEVARLAALGVLLAARTSAAEALTSPAEPLTFRLSWVRGEGAEQCPNAEQLAAAVEARLGRAAFSEPARRHIEGSVVRADGAWRVQLRVIGADNAVLGSRELEANGQDCSSIADAASLAVALAIDPHALDERSEPPRRMTSELPLLAPPPAPPEAPAARAAAPSTSAASPVVPGGPSRSGALTGEVVPRGLFAVGILPDAGLGAELGTELRLAHGLGLSMSMAYLPEQRTTSGQLGLSLTAASLGMCFWALDRPRALLKICGELMAGAVQVVVYDPIPTHPGEHLWLAPRFGPRFAYRLGERLSLEVSAFGVAPLLREGFSITGVEAPLFRTAPLSVLFSLGLRVSIP
jgi:hypothetical protein